MRVAGALALVALLGCDDGGDDTSRDDSAVADAAVDLSAPDATSTPDATVTLDASSVRDGAVDAIPEPDAPAPDAPQPDALPEPDVAADAAVDHAAPTSRERPASRMTAVEVPQTPVDARRAGCALYGESAGTDVRNVFQLLGGGLTRFLVPNAQGQIQLVILLQAPDWPLGASALDLERLHLELLDGLHFENREFRVTPRTFVDGDPALGPRVTMEVAVEDGWIESQPTAVLIPLPLLSATTVLLRLELARLGGRLAADGPGFRIDRGHLAGYLTDDGLRDLVVQVRALCMGEEPPGVCALLGDQLNQPIDQVVNLIRGIVGENDVWVDEARARDCDGDQEPCNAVAVCLALSARGVEIAGLVP